MRSASSRRHRLAFRTSPTSRATGSPHEQATSPEYWAQQLRRSVRFADGAPPASGRPRRDSARGRARSDALLRSRAGIPTATTRSSSSRLCRGPRRASQTMRSPSRRSAGCGSQASRSTGRACTRARGRRRRPSARVPVRAPSLLGGCGGARAERASDRAEGARGRRLVLRADVGVRARSDAGAADRAGAVARVRRERRARERASPAGCSMPATT